MKVHYGLGWLLLPVFVLLFMLYWAWIMVRNSNHRPVR